MTENWSERDVDVLIVGTGLAGLRAAVEAARFGQRVLLVDKNLIGVNNNTALAGGGFKAALPQILDTSVEKQYATPDEHFCDMVEYGEFVADQSLADVLALEAPGRILELREFNIPHFEALCTYGLNQPIELADNSAVVDANPARGGQAVTRALVKECKRLGVQTIDGCILLDLLRGPSGIVGALFYRIFAGTFIVCRARAVVLATGGAGEVFRINYTTNVTTGDGYAVAHRAGANLVGMEFTMFSPHTMMEPGLPMWYLLPCEARLHSVYRNARGERFLDAFLNPTGEDSANFQRRYGELSSDIREVISRAVAIEIFEGRGDGDSIYLDFSDVPESYWEADLPSRYNLRCLVRGFDWKNKPIRISPGALTHLGGVEIKSWGETGLDGLYACGEVAAPVHGARRRGGNAFTECLVFGARAGRAAAEFSQTANDTLPPFDLSAVKERIAEIKSWDRKACAEGDPIEIKKEIQATMWRNAGPLRTRERLEECLDDLARIRQERISVLHANTPFEVKSAVEVNFILEVADMIAKCALFRSESRGGHFRADFPEIDNNNWRCQSVCRLGEGPSKRPVEITRFNPPEIPGAGQQANA